MAAQGVPARLVVDATGVVLKVRVHLKRRLNRTGRHNRTHERFLGRIVLQLAFVGVLVTCKVGVGGLSAGVAFCWALRALGDTRTRAGTLGGVRVSAITVVVAMG